MDSTLGLSVTTWMDEVSIFCPVEVITGSRVYDGLLDHIDGDGGRFYILTGEAREDSMVSGDGVVPEDGRPVVVPGQKIVLFIHAFGKHFHLPCRVRKLSFDDDGLFVYASLKFLAPDGTTQKRLVEYLSSLW